MNELIQIILVKGVYHANDCIVQTDDSVSITTSIVGQIFRVVVPNEDHFFDLMENGIPVTIIRGNVSLNHPLVLGNVTGEGKPTKYYEINPSTDAPPRIIRVPASV